MQITDSEQRLLEHVRRAQAADHYAEHVILLRYIPTDFEGGFIQQILPGQPQSLLQMRTAMKKLLDDFQTLELSSNFFTIAYDSGLLQLFKH